MLQVVYKVFTVVPHSSKLMPSTAEVIVVVRHEDQTGIEAFLHDSCEFLRFVGIWRELRIGVAHRELVVFTDALHVSVRQIDAPVVGDFNERRWIVHHAFPAVAARQIVVRKSQSMTDLVSRQLTHAIQRHIDRS